jgi:mRNA interferase MazF
MNEAWRHLDCRRRQGLCGQAAPGRNRFDATDWITVCAFTTYKTEAPLFRLPVEPNERNGLRATCRLMVDKITAVPKTKVGSRVGRLDDEDILRLNQAALVLLASRCRREPSRRHERQPGPGRRPNASPNNQGRRDP